MLLSFVSVGAGVLMSAALLVMHSAKAGKHPSSGSFVLVVAAHLGLLLSIVLLCQVQTVSEAVVGAALFGVFGGVLYKSLHVLNAMETLENKDTHVLPMWSFRSR